MDLPKRKQLRLQQFDYNQNGAYFITLCVKDRKQILSNIVGDDAHIVPKKCGEIVEKYIKNVPEIKKYVIMPDHIHMIIDTINGSMKASTPTRNISSVVRSLKALTTKEIGQSIFQRSFYDHVIRNEQDYKEVWDYIEKNPYRWIEKQKTTQGD